MDLNGLGVVLLLLSNFFPPLISTRLLIFNFHTPSSQTVEPEYENAVDSSETDKETSGRIGGEFWGALDGSGGENEGRRKQQGQTAEGK